MLGLYIAAVLAAESSSGCPLPCGAVCLELIDHKDCRGSPCSQQELEFGELCTGDATCGDAGRCGGGRKGKPRSSRRRRGDSYEASLRRRALSDDGDPTARRPTGRRRRGATSSRATGASSTPSSSGSWPSRSAWGGAVAAPQRSRWSAGARGCPTSWPFFDVVAGVRRASTTGQVAEPGQGAARVRVVARHVANATSGASRHRRPGAGERARRRACGHGNKNAQLDRVAGPILPPAARVIRRRPPEVGPEAARKPAAAARTRAWAARMTESRFRRWSAGVVGWGAGGGGASRHGDERRRVHAPHGEEPARPGR